MVKAVSDFLFGLFFGMGFAIANAVLAFIVAILGKGVKLSLLDWPLWSLIG